MNPLHNLPKADEPPTDSLIRDLDRICNLPRREVIDCDRINVKLDNGKIERRFEQKAQALVEFITNKYSLGPRTTCACSLVLSYKKRGLPFEQGWKQFIIDKNKKPWSEDPIFQGFWCEAKITSKPRIEEKCFAALWGHPCITTLNAVQAWTLFEMPLAGGVHGLLSVGAGKTIIGLLAPLAMPDTHTAVLLGVPTQRIHYQNAYVRLREHFRVPSMRFHEDDFPGFIVSGMPSLHFLPYSRLQNKKATVLLYSIEPDLIIADEAHCLSNKASTRTGRVTLYFADRDKRGLNTRLCDWSGTMVKKSVKDQSHLLAYALGTNSPLPLLPDDVEAWSAVVDPGPAPDRVSGTYKQLKATFGNKEAKGGMFSTAEDIRIGMRERLVHTLGVVTTKASTIDATVYLTELKAPEIPDLVMEKLEMARAGERPDGEELQQATEIALCARQVACGYYYYWAYPRGESRELIDAWFLARKAWRKEVRNKLFKPEPHLDSPDLLKHAAERAWREIPYEGDLPVWRAESWPAWAAIADKVYHEQRTAWIGEATATQPATLDKNGHIVGEYLARKVAQWAKENRGVVWCMSRAFGMKVAELAGLPYHGGGVDAEARILSEKGDRSVIASIRSHGASRDGLQLLFNTQLIAELPSSGDIFEQLFGRLSRIGQSSDEIQTYLYFHVPENRDAYDKAVELAEFSSAMTPNQQVLLSAVKTNFT